MSARSEILVSRIILSAAVAAGAAAGLALLWSAHKARAERGAASKAAGMRDAATCDTDGVPPLFHLAGNEAVVYLRGYMDGQRGKAA
ncbi:hypothetical protein GCM10010112_87390 [Actinoplanes lobatus]|uniref:Uncharacterized protein n=2 Tax=Actinoplanes lobatus TaxID=113568 RepID=A0ABQ4AWA3_9ACTN|nr:hypothetical protein GCM10010112_87390 [Actinoplanes lobatus]GIE45203.1 hypothetical protein Alo02nite_81010 [Actinoplanes lobatus]